RAPARRAVAKHRAQGSLRLGQRRAADGFVDARHLSLGHRRALWRRGLARASPGHYSVQVDPRALYHSIGSERRFWDGVELAGRKNLTDTEFGVAIDVLITGDYPGDGNPKPITFPDPAAVAIRGSDARFLPLGPLIELKLASGISASHRLRDLADVQELIKAA